LFAFNDDTIVIFRNASIMLRKIYAFSSMNKVYFTNSILETWSFVLYKFQWRFSFFAANGKAV